MTVKAVATAPAHESSDTASATFIINLSHTQVAAPEFSPSPGAYETAQQVAITCATPASSIRFTTDGTDPSTSVSSTLYDGAIPITATTIIKAMGLAADMDNSDMVTAVYSIASATAGTEGRYFWGRWVRMDKNEEWRVTDTELSIAGAAARSISSMSDTALVFSGGRIDQKTENTAEAVFGTSTYTLFKRDGAFGTLTGRIMADQSVSRQSRLLGGVGSIKVIVKNLANAADVHEAVTDSTGVFTVPEVIPNETYEIIPQASVEVPLVPPPAILIPNKTTEDAGTLVAAPVSYNFKMSCEQSTEYMYESQTQYYDIEISVTNTGSQNNIATTYAITPDSGMNFSTTSLTDILGSITAGSFKSIPLRVRCTSVTGAYQDKKVFILLTDIDGKTWEDSVSLRFYKREVAFNISSLVNPVFGVVITPDRKTVQFSTANPSNQYFSTQVRLPYQPGYLIAFSKATESSEAKYGFGIDSPAPTSPELTAFNTPSVFEPNDDEDQAYEMAVSDVVASYLHMGDADYFVLVDNKASMPAISTGYPRGGAYTGLQIVRLSTATTDATIKYTVNGDDPDATTGTVYSTNSDILITQTSTLKAIAIKSGFMDSAMMKEEYVFPMSVTISAYERFMLGYWTTVKFANQTERWLGFEITQDGDYDLSLSDAGEGQAGETVDAFITLVDEGMIPVSGAVNVDSAYSTPIPVHLAPGIYLCRVKEKNTLAVTGTCFIGVSAHVVGE